MSLFLCASLLLAAAAPGAAPPPAAGPALTLSAKTRTLPNGLVVLTAPDRSVPGVAVTLWYRVGSRDEEPGRTGFAHLFEHLMFMGARAVPYPKFDTLMEAAGGVNNAHTGNDATVYWEIGPSNLLETFLWMEADRMASLGATMTAEKLQAQRLIVLNERRQSYENRPYGLADLAAVEQLYPAGHPYSWPVIGSAKDLEAATLADVKKFFATWYVPDNAVLSVAGDFDEAQLQQLVDKYFTFLPRKELPAPRRPQPWSLSGEKRLALTDKVELPKLILEWKSAPFGTQRDAECDLLATVLARGKASRLYQRLVQKEQAATEVRAEQESLDLEGAFQIAAIARPGRTTAELQRLIDEETARLAAEGPTQAELEAARLRMWSDAAHGLEGLQDRSERLAGYYVRLGDANALERDLGRYQAATRDSLQAAAKELFAGGRLVIEVQPEGKPEAAQAGGAK
jgi:zinc protease